MGLARSERARGKRTILTGLVLAVAHVASAEPMDLARFEPRWVAVRFEISPADRPGQTDTVYSAPLAAWLEPGETEWEIRVTVASDLVEAHLFDDHDPVAGSFSDFSWTFDARSGEVLSARLDGRLWHELPFGHAIQAPIRVRMDTRRRAGFARPRSLLGHEYRSLCAAADGDCTLVEPRVYDRETGYVNAVGAIHAHSGPFRVRSFSPLGEAIFSERPDLPADTAAATATDGAVLNF